jgi:hypothetical protein
LLDNWTVLTRPPLSRNEVDQLPPSNRNVMTVVGRLVEYG